jgi:hypothetical protein
VGKSFEIGVQEMGYSRLHYDYDPSTKKFALRAGWSNSGTTLQELLRSYESALYSHKFINRSAMALDECLKFQFNANARVEHTGFAKGENDDPSGARENHGDRVIADALCWRMMKPTVVAMERKKEEEPEHAFGSLGWRQSLRNKKTELNWLDRGRRTPRDANTTVWSGSNHG